MRGNTRGVCPECGTVLRRDTRQLSDRERENANAVIDSLLQVRKGVCWSLVVWFGCVAVPYVGPLAWVVLALASCLRAVARWRLESTGFPDAWKGKGLVGSWWQLTVAETAIAVCCGAFTIVVSRSDIPPALVFMLLLARLVWLCLLTLNNLCALLVGLATIQKYGDAPAGKHYQFGPLVLLGAPILCLPHLVVVAGSSIGKAPVWLDVIVQFLFVMGCIFGITSVFMIYSILETATDAIHQSRIVKDPLPARRPVDVGPTSPTPRPAPRAAPDPPPQTDVGDVIPFADDPPSSTH